MVRTSHPSPESTQGPVHAARRSFRPGVPLRSEFNLGRLALVRDKSVSRLAHLGSEPAPSSMRTDPLSTRTCGHTLPSQAATVTPPTPTAATPPSIAPNDPLESLGSASHRDRHDARTRSAPGIAGPQSPGPADKARYPSPAERKPTRFRPARPGPDHPPGPPTPAPSGAAPSAAGAGSGAGRT
jgi:hypothetical protein